MHAHGATALLAAIGAAGALSSDVPHMREPSHLPPLARALLHDRMKDHRAAMAGLTWSVILLDRAAAAEAAQEIANGPKLARTDPASGDLNGALPPRFFDLQDELHVRSADLSRAARSGNDAAMGKAYGKLAETCVACHSVYLEDR